MIASDAVPQAIKLLLDFVTDFSANNEDLNEVIVLSSNYNRLETIARRRLLTFEELEVKQNKLLYQMLGLLDMINEKLLQKMEA